MSEKKFVLRARMMLLTYKTWIDKKEYLNWVNDKFNNVVFVRLGHESGDEKCEYKHTHVVIELKNRTNYRDPRCLDYDGIHPNIKTLSSKRALNDAKKYIAKEDSENEDLLVVENCFIDNVLRSADIIEAFKCGKRYGDIGGIETIFRYRTPIVDDPIEEPNMQWQFELLDRLKQKPDRRKVIWICDPVGGLGKSTLGDYLERSQGNDWYGVEDMGNMRDAASIINSALEGGWTSRGIIIDLPRMVEGHERLYVYIEAIKNGKMTMTKYAGRRIKFNRPHVVVMANWFPQVHCLSMDRWEIYKIEKDSGLIPINAYTL